MRATQAVMLLIGLAVAGYGFALLWDNPRVILFRIIVWALVGVVLHDLVFAPLCVAVGLVGRRLLPRGWRAPVAVGAFCSVVLVMLAIPVFDKPGLRPDNLTVLDRDYHAGLWISLAVVWACVPLYVLAARLLPVRQNQVVEGERADAVDGQPPAVR